jgi:hypothetical protein
MNELLVKLLDSLSEIETDLSNAYGTLESESDNTSDALWPIEESRNNVEKLIIEVSQFIGEEG